MYFTGEGHCSVYKNIDTSKRIQLGEVNEGTMIGAISVLFNIPPILTIESHSYCSMVMIKNKCFNEMLI